MVFSVGILMAICTRDESLKRILHEKHQTIKIMHFLSLSQSVDTNVIETMYRQCSINVTLERPFSTKESNRSERRKSDSSWYMFLTDDQNGPTKSFKLNGYLISDRRNWKMILFTIWWHIFNVMFEKDFRLRLMRWTLDILRNWIHQSQHDQDFEDSFHHQKKSLWLIIHY